MSEPVQPLDQSHRSHGLDGPALHGLFEPFILLSLSESPVPTHGYHLHERLAHWGLAASLGRVNLYRLLHRLRRDGLVQSTWQAGENGPRRRVYTLTIAGWEMLHRWECALERDRRVIELFLQRMRTRPHDAGAGG
jgi:DNA-binding PadR family transcriptional regulator